MSIQKMTGVAVFAALVAVFSQMSLLIGPVPHTMQIFAVTLAGVVLDRREEPCLLLFGSCWVLSDYRFLPWRMADLPLCSDRLSVFLSALSFMHMYAG